MSKKNVVIFFGGCSSEYSVSLESAYSVISAINVETYCPIPVGITEDGKWFYFGGSKDKIRDDTWHTDKSCFPAVLSPNRDEHCLLIFKENMVERVSVDAAFPVLHGKNGEDGTLQGLIELAGIPLVGCGTLASALCMDKDRAHKLAHAAGVPVPSAIVLAKEDFISNQLSNNIGKLKDFVISVGYPLFVKPVKAGSSYGITKVWREEELASAVKLAFQYDNQVIVEENINGFEVGCAVMGNLTLTTGEVDEIELLNGFFDFTEKYTLKTSAIHVPARISKEKSDAIKQTAKIIYRTLGCRGFARVDMFLTPEGRIVFNEVNTIPGFTEHSRYPGMMKAVGMSFSEIIDRVIALALGT